MSQIRSMAQPVVKRPGEVGVHSLDAFNFTVPDLAQAEKFSKAVKCTGIILTKLDGSAKGGAVFAIKQKLGLPVKYVGVGEQIDDLEPFDPDSFVEALFAKD